MVTKVRIDTVEQAAEWMDNVRPEWYNKIDINKLDLYNGDECILGQVFKEEAETGDKYSNGWCHATNLWPETFINAFADDTLRQEWVDEIQARLERKM